MSTEYMVVSKRDSPMCVLFIGENKVKNYLHYIWIIILNTVVIITSFWQCISGNGREITGQF